MQIRIKKTERSRRVVPWWAKSLRLSLGATILSCLILAFADYPGEHWPMAAVTIVITVFVVSLCSEILLMLAFMRLRSYRSAVFRKHGVDLGKTQVVAEGYRPIVIVVTAVMALSFAAATWGVGLYAFQWTAGWSNLPSATSAVYLTGLVALVLGASVVAVLVMLPFGMVALVDRFGPRAERAASVAEPVDVVVPEPSVAERSDAAQVTPQVVGRWYGFARSFAMSSHRFSPSFIFQASGAR